MILVACYAIPVVQDAILIARNGQKTVSTFYFVSWPKILGQFQESMVKLYREKKKNKQTNYYLCDL